MNDQYREIEDQEIQEWEFFWDDDWLSEEDDTTYEHLELIYDK